MSLQDDYYDLKAYLEDEPKMLKSFERVWESIVNIKASELISQNLKLADEVEQESQTFKIETAIYTMSMEDDIEPEFVSVKLSTKHGSSTVPIPKKDLISACIQMMQERIGQRSK